MHPMLNIATQAIRKASIFIIKQYELLDKNYTKLSEDNIKNFLTITHKESHNIISTIIQKFYPNHIIIKINDKKYTPSTRYNEILWIIEAIDSNINFIKQFPFFTLSIAIQYQGKTNIGVIYDPIHNELFTACRGKGAQFNGYRIRLNQKNFLQPSNKTMLTMALSSQNYNNLTTIKILKEFHKKHSIIINLRCTGSLNLDLIYVVINRLDGCIIISSENPIKLASSLLIVQESGGLITDFIGNEINNNNYEHITNLIVGNSKIIKNILPIIKNFVN